MKFDINKNKLIFAFDIALQVQLFKGELYVINIKKVF